MYWHLLNQHALSSPPTPYRVLNSDQLCILIIDGPSDKICRTGSRIKRLKSLPVRDSTALIFTAVFAIFANTIPLEQFFSVPAILTGTKQTV